MDIKDFNKLYEDVRNPSEDEFGEPQTGDKRIPIYQNIRPGYDVYESMPTYGGDYFQQQIANGGRVGYGFGGIISKFINALKPQAAQSAIPTTPVAPVDTDVVADLVASSNSTMPSNSTTPSDLTTPFISTKPFLPVMNSNISFGGLASLLAEALKMGILKYADGGQVGYQYGGGAIGYSSGGLAPITSGVPIAPGYAYGGYISQGEPVNTDLTRTIPPVRGPNPQGVESLFKKRYN